MSFKAIQAVYNRFTSTEQTSCAEQAVLVALAYHCPDKPPHTIFPGRDRLVQETHCNMKTLDKVRASLREKGIIDYTPGIGKGSTMYRLMFPIADKPQVVEEPQTQEGVSPKLGRGYPQNWGEGVPKIGALTSSKPQENHQHQVVVDFVLEKVEEVLGHKLDQASRDQIAKHVVGWRVDTICKQVQELKTAVEAGKKIYNHVGYLVTLLKKHCDVPSTTTEQEVPVVRSEMFEDYIKYRRTRQGASAVEVKEDVSGPDEGEASS